jgi:hypothetical protein
LNSVVAESPSDKTVNNESQYSLHENPKQGISSLLQLLPFAVHAFNHSTPLLLSRTLAGNKNLASLC